MRTVQLVGTNSFTLYGKGNVTIVALKRKETFSSDDDDLIENLLSKGIGEGDEAHSYFREVFPKPARKAAPVPDDDESINDAPVKPATTRQRQPRKPAAAE